MPNADDLLTGKASVDDILGISPKGRVNTSIEFDPNITPIESDPNQLKVPLSGGGEATTPPPELTKEDVAAALLRGAGPTALSALAGGVLGLATTRSPGGAMMAGRMMAAAPVVGDLGVGMINKMFGTNYSGPTEAFQHLFTHLGVPEPQSAASKVIESASRAGAESLATSGASAMMAAGRAPGAATDVLNLLAEAPGTQAAAAATGGAASEAVKQGGGGEGAQFAAGLTGALVGGGLAGLRPTSKVAIRESVKGAEGQGMVPMTSDVLPPTGMFGKFAQRVRESVPLTGTAGKLAAQQETKIAASRGLMAEYRANAAENIFNTADPAIEKVTKDLLENRRNMLKKYTTMRRNAMNNAAASGAPTVPTPRAIAALDNQINKLSGTADYADVVKILKGYKKDLQGFNNIDNIEAIREAMGNRFASAEMSQYKDIGQKSIESIYPHLRADMEQFISTHGSAGDLNAFKIANKRLFDEFKDLSRKSLKMALDKGDLEPEVAAKMLFSGKKSDVQALYNGLTPEGKQSARAAILERAWKNMAVANKGVNPDRFASELKKLGTEVGVMFRGADLERARGFVQAIELLQRAGKFAEMGPTGVVGQIPMVGGSLATIFAKLTSGTEGAIGTAGAILGTGALGRIYESPIVRDILLRIPKLSSGSSEQMALTKRLVNAIQAQAAAAETD